MSEFFFKCPHCGANLCAEDSMIGTQMPCPGCGNTIIPRKQTFQEKNTAGAKSAANSPKKKRNSIHPWSSILHFAAVVVFIFGWNITSSFSQNLALILTAIFHLCLLAWFVQQVYLSNELKREQISLLKEIRDKMK